MRFIFFIFIFLPNLLFGECLKTELKIHFNRKTETEDSTLCKIKKNDLVFYVSKSCEHSECDILKREKKDISIPDYQSKFGTPGFKLCKALGGIGQIFQYKDEQKKWQSADRCFFQKDFVEISLLTYEWKAYIK